MQNSIELFLILVLLRYETADELESPDTPYVKSCLRVTNSSILFQSIHSGNSLWQIGLCTLYFWTFLQIFSDSIGYGFVIRGIGPTYVQTVDPEGPAADAGLKVSTPFTHQTPVPRSYTHPYQHTPFLKGYKFRGVHMAVVVIIVFRYFRFASTYTQWMVSTFCVKTTIKWPKGLWEVIKITSTFVWCHTNVTLKTNKTHSVPQSYFIYSDVHVLQKLHIVLKYI